MLPLSFKNPKLSLGMTSTVSPMTKVFGLSSDKEVSSSGAANVSKKLEETFSKTTGGASTLSHGSIESDEPDQDTDVDNQITSVASSRSNMSETSVRINLRI